ncbi:MAG: SGNH/GDSL hydrolase family protein [Novosphingobium sp.]
MGAALAIFGVVTGAGFALAPDIPRWTGSGSRVVTGEPLPSLPAAFSPIAVPGRIVCIGDSNTRGSRLDRGESAFPALMARDLAGTIVRNHGIGGETVALARLRPEVRTGPGDLVILMFGTNDARVRGWLSRTPYADPVAYRQDLATLATVYHDTGAQVLVLGPLPTGATAMERRIRPYRSAAREAAGLAGVFFLDPVEAFAADAVKPPLAFDGIHLNQQGQIALARWLVRFIRPVRQ